ncbi:MAG: hypothetical protein GON13_03260 [Nanoarchaeota archaeon]|nr:hypothetical protein [Nanoarchaeota archaeon]
MKAQVFTMDFIISIILFMSMMIMISILWSTLTIDLESKKSFDDMMFQALSTSELLVKDGGNPTNWTTSVFYSLGLAESENVLEWRKISYFVELVLNDYSSVKDVLGLSDDFYFELYDLTNSTTIVSAPLISLESYDNVAAVNRIVLVNNSLARFSFAIVR